MKKQDMDKLNQMLLQCMTNDLYDPDKCTPGLYQVVRGYLNDNKEILDGIPKEALDFLDDKLSDAIPFKKEAS